MEKNSVEKETDKMEKIAKLNEDSVITYDGMRYLT